MAVALIKEDIDRWFEYGVYPRTRTIYLGGIHGYDHGEDEDHLGESGIYWNTARRMIQSLHLLDSNIDQPITVVMNSVGGDWQHGMAIYDAIRLSKCHITIINMSHARSMTSLIFQAADLRIIAPNGYYMIHDGTSGFGGIPRSAINWIQYEKDVILPKMYSIYLERIKEVDGKGEYKVDIHEAAEILNSKIPDGSKRILPSRGIEGIKLSHIQALCSQDTIFTPTEMIRLNFVDRMMETGDLVGAYVNPKMHGLPTGLESLQDEDE